MSNCTILTGDVTDKLCEIEAGSVHMVMTSPPYWGLRDYGVEGQLGLEKTPQEYVELAKNRIAKDAAQRILPGLT